MLLRNIDPRRLLPVLLVVLLGVSSIVRAETPDFASLLFRVTF